MFPPKNEFRKELRGVQKGHVKKTPKNWLKRIKSGKISSTDKPRKSVHQNKTKFKSKGLKPIGRISKNHTIATTTTTTKTNIRKQTNKQNRKVKLLLAV